MDLTFYTIGVYGSSENSFFESLRSNQIDTFLDIRQRRGVRGAKYAFVNSQRLQMKLSEMGIAYRHILELAPTKEIRELQKIADVQSGVAKRERGTLGQVFKITYKDRILKKFPLVNLIGSLKEDGAKRVVMFCVEEAPRACHRSIVTDRIEQEFGTITKHL